MVDRPKRGATAPHQTHEQRNATPMIQESRTTGTNGDQTSDPVCSWPNFSLGRPSRPFPDALEISQHVEEIV